MILDPKNLDLDIGHCASLVFANEDKLQIDCISDEQYQLSSNFLKKIDLVTGHDKLIQIIDLIIRKKGNPIEFSIQRVSKSSYKSIMDSLITI